MRRFASVFLPRWPIERREGARPGSVPAETPFALLASARGRLVLSAVNGPAAGAGLRPGQGLADARAAVPALASAPAEPRSDRRALLRLALWTGRYGTRFGIEAPADPEGPAGPAEADGIWIEITGVAHLFGGEAGLLRDLDRRLAGFGLSACLGLADTPGAAWALARFAPTDAFVGRIAPPGQGARALAGLPVAALRLDHAAVLLLGRLGLKRIGDLQPLPRQSLERRFPSRAAAAAVLLRLDQALGVKGEPLRPLLAPPRHRVARAFAEPLVTAAGLETALTDLVAELGAALAAADAGARRLTLTLYRSDGSLANARAGLSRPSRSGAHMLRLLMGKLDGLDAGFGIDLLTLAAHETGRLSPEQGAFAASAAEERASRLLDRLAGRLGEDSVLRLSPRQSHLPERAECRVVALAAAPAAVAAPVGLRPGLPRPPLLLPSPEPITVLAAVPDGPPVTILWRRASRRVVKAQGPERIGGEWWRAIAGTEAEAPRPRDYYHVEDEAGRRYFLYREGLYGAGRAPAWFMHGLGG